MQAIGGLTMRQLAIAIIAMHMDVVGAKAADTTITIVGGSCQSVEVASQQVACGSPSSVVYSALPNGIVLFNVPLADGRVCGFVGDRDSQPKPEVYVLYLKRVRLARGSEGGTPIDVSGTCTVDVSTDGTLVHRILCDATDGQGGKYRLDFRGDGRPVEVKHF